ncbi:MAG: hypothetical protein AAFY88_13295, partial [Acidobacteriota bacterium]
RTGGESWQYVVDPDRVRARLRAHSDECLSADQRRSLLQESKEEAERRALRCQAECLPAFRAVLEQSGSEPAAMEAYAEACAPPGGEVLAPLTTLLRCSQ